MIVFTDERNISLDIGFSTYYCRFNHGCNAVHVDVGFYNWAGDVPQLKLMFALIGGLLIFAAIRLLLRKRQS